MKTRDILDRKGAEVVTVSPWCSVQRAIRELCEHHIGALIVVDERGGLVGVVSERDVMMDCGYQCSQLESLADGKTCPRFVSEIMTREVITGELDDEIEHVMAVMTHNRVRHLPVLDGGRLVGVVSLGDVVNAHLDRTVRENESLKDYIGDAP
jgi:CBS domain-containing protein